jgi:metal-responsive CopG/Arc/MetJ family transcriptional regulator
MADLVRLSFSIDAALADVFEEMVKQSGYGNRSEFFRDMIRERLVAKEWEIGRDEATCVQRSSSAADGPERSAPSATDYVGRRACCTGRCP